MSQSILHIQEKPEVDESTREYEYVEYQPISGSQFNISGQITVTIEDIDVLYFHLVKAADETRYQV